MTVEMVPPKREKSGVANPRVASTWQAQAGAPEVQGCSCQHNEFKTN